MPYDTAAKARRDDLHLLRRVQKTGHSSLFVTLPRSWIHSANVRPGDVLEFKELAGERLELSVSHVVRTPSGRQKTLRIETQVSDPNLFARLLVGAYITGHDSVQIVGSSPLTEAQRADIDYITKKILGMTLVEESTHQVEVQISVDPGKYEFARLLQRTVRLLDQAVELCRRSLREGNPSVLDRLPLVEDEIDRFYLLMVRQLLLASDDFHVAVEIGVTSHHFQIGSRLVAKVLEMNGDLLADIGHELGSWLGTDRAPLSKTADSMDRMLADFDSFLHRTMEAFLGLSLLGANSTLNDISRWLSHQYGLEDRKGHLVRTKEGPPPAQRIAWDLVMAVEMLVEINEITINRYLEPETILRSTSRNSISIPAEILGSLPGSSAPIAVPVPEKKSPDSPAHGSDTESPRAVGVSAAAGRAPGRSRVGGSPVLSHR
jgi:phosphate uptake regulator